MITTYNDLTQHALVYLGLDVSSQGSEVAAIAVREAYRTLTAEHRWLYYMSRARLNSFTPYMTGTIAYDQTGGAQERMATLTGGTWPDWTRGAFLSIANVPYEVAERVSDSVLTLTPQSNPGADVAALTTFLLYRDTYTMPPDFLAADEVINLNHMIALQYLHPRSWISQNRIIRAPATPRNYTFTGSPDEFGAMSIRFYPPPDQAYQFDLLMYRKPRPMNLVRHPDAPGEGGSVSITSGGSTVTGTGTAFTQAMVGAIMRFGAVQEEPTAFWGLSPAVLERTIMSVASATSLEVDALAPSTLAGVRYLISDPIDMEEGAMRTALLREIELQARIMRRIKATPEEMQAHRESLLGALEADSRSMSRRAAGDQTAARYRLRDFPYTWNS